MALLARATRSSLLEVLAGDYVRTARSKGLHEALVVRRHALRNALIPVVTIGGILLAEVLVGSFYVETVFAVPGIGSYFVTSVTSRDYPVLMGVTLLMTTVVTLVNLARRPELRLPGPEDPLWLSAAFVADGPVATGGCACGPFNLAGPLAAGHGSSCRASKFALFGLALLALLLLTAIFADVLAPYPPTAQNVALGRRGPSAAHWLGTDELGRDMLSRLIYGARISLSVAIVAQIVILLIGVPVGAAAGYFGGWVDGAALAGRRRAVQLPGPAADHHRRDVASGGAQVGAGGVLGAARQRWTRRWPGCSGSSSSLALVSWLTVARLVRGQVLSLKEREFIEAARASGAHDGRIIVRHLLPNVLPAIVVAATLGIPARDPGRGGALVHRDWRAAADSQLGRDDPGRLERGARRQSAPDPRAGRRAGADRARLQHRRRRAAGSVRPVDAASRPARQVV